MEKRVTYRLRSVRGKNKHAEKFSIRRWAINSLEFSWAKKSTEIRSTMEGKSTGIVHLRILGFGTAMLETLHTDCTAAQLRFVKDQFTWTLHDSITTAIHGHRISELIKNTSVKFWIHRLLTVNLFKVLKHLTD